MRNNEAGQENEGEGDESVSNDPAAEEYPLRTKQTTYLLKSDGQFSTRVMGAVLSGGAVTTKNLLPSGETS
jgi:hypothetical protein